MLTISIKAIFYYWSILILPFDFTAEFMLDYIGLDRISKCVISNKIGWFGVFFLNSILTYFRDL